MKKIFVAVILALMLAMGTHSQASQQSASQTITITIVSKLGLNTTTLSSIVVGQTYNVQLSASGGTLPYTYSIDAASPNPLPAGLTLNASTGAITGTVTALPSTCVTGQPCSAKITFDVVDSTP